MAGLQTEFEFTLPKGFVDNYGNLHRKGVMRLATAMDEISPLRDPRVRANQAYLTIIILANVVTKLGTLTESEIHTGVMERLYSSDLAYLQALYNRINSPNIAAEGAICPITGKACISGEGEEVAPNPGG